MHRPPMKWLQEWPVLLRRVRKWPHSSPSKNQERSTSMHARAKVVGALALSGMTLLLLGVVLLTTVLSVVLGGGTFSGAGGPPPAGAVYGGDNAVTLAAK